MGVCRLRAGVGDRDLPILQWRCGREASDLQDFHFVEGFPLQQGSGERLGDRDLSGRDLERLAVNSAPIPYRSLGIALRFTPNLIKGEPTSGLEPLT